MLAAHFPPVRPMKNVNVVLKRSAADILQVGRIQVRILEDGSLTDQRLSVVEVSVPPKTTQTPRHIHSAHEETFLVTGGTLQFTIANGVYNAAVGDFVVVPIGASHTIANPFDAPATFVCTFTPAFFLGYFREIAEHTKAGPLTREIIAEVISRYDTQLG